MKYQYLIYNSSIFIVPIFIITTCGSFLSFILVLHLSSTMLVLTAIPYSFFSLYVHSKLGLFPHRITFQTDKIVIERLSLNKAKVKETTVFSTDRIRSISNPSHGSAGLRIEVINGNTFTYAVWMSGLFYKDDSQELYRDLKYHIQNFNARNKILQMDDKDKKTLIAYGYKNYALIAGILLLIISGLGILGNGVYLSVYGNSDPKKIIGGMFLLAVSFVLYVKYFDKK